MVDREFELYYKYELRGRGTAFKAYIPFEIKGDKVMCLSVSEGARISEEDIEEFKELINNNLLEGDNKVLVKCRKEDENEIDQFAEKLRQYSGNSVGKDKKEEIYRSISK
jgi:hypothetical protein